MSDLRTPGVSPKIRSAFNRFFPLRQSKSESETTLPLKGYPASQVRSAHLDNLTDEQLTELNNIVRWNCFTVDSHGRRFGNRAKAGKRDTPQALPDDRISLLHNTIGLTDRTVLELGCFEGVHTTGLCQFASEVTAVDVRIENVVKTLLRCGMYGVTPHVFLADVDSIPLDPRLPEVDVCFHCGVLYHLVDPVAHLQELLARVKYGILLDTHYAKDEDAKEVYNVGNRAYPYKRYAEHGMHNVFAGAYDHAKWLTLGTLQEILTQAGFSKFEKLVPREERNGSRVMIIARKP